MVSAMDKLDGVLIDTDVLVVGAGAGGLIAALSAKRNGPPGTRVTLVDSWMIGRTGHTAFSNAWTIVALPGDDIDGILHEIVAGNDGIADQVLVRQSLVDSAARLKDFEAMGMHFGRDEAGRLQAPADPRPRSRARDVSGGRRARIRLEAAARARARRRATDRPAVHHRADARRLATASPARSASTAAPASSTSSRREPPSSPPMPSRSARASCATSPAPARCWPIAPARACAMRNSATCVPARRSSISRASPSRSRRARAGSTPRARRSWTSTSRSGAIRPTCRASPRAMAMENRKGNTPLYLDMSPIPEHLREYFIQSKVRWMDNFFRKLGDEAKTDMFGKTPYYALNQMTKMGIRTGADCRSDVPGLVVGWAGAGRLRQSFRRLPHRALRRQRLDRGQVGDRGPRATAGTVARCGRSPRAACRDQRADESCGQRGIRPHPARSAGA